MSSPQNPVITNRPYPTQWINSQKVIVPVELLVNVNQILKMIEKERTFYQEQILLLKEVNLKLRENEIKMIRTIRSYLENIKEIIACEESFIPNDSNNTSGNNSNNETNLPEQIKPELSDFLCQICLDKPRNCLLEPCMHFCVCQGCVNKITDSKCPICRRKVDYFQNVFIS